MKYQVREIDFESHAGRIVEMMQGNLGNAELDKDGLRRDFCNPGHPALLNGLFTDDDELVGLMVVKRMPWSRDGEAIDVCLLGDWSVDPAHRTLFPAMMLARHSVARGLDEHSVLTGFPNEKAEPVFVRSWKDVCHLGGMRRFARVMNVAGILSERVSWLRWLGCLAPLEAGLRRLVACTTSRGSTLRAHAVDQLDELPRIEPLPGMFRKELTPEFLRWRFGIFHPERYRVLTMQDGNGRQAIAVAEQAGKVVHLRDLVWDPGFALKRLPALLQCRFAPEMYSLSLSLLDNDFARQVAKTMGMHPREINRPFYVAVKDFDEAKEPGKWVVTDACEDR